MPPMSSAEKYLAVKTYLLTHFPLNYAGSRRNFKDGELRFVLDFGGSARIVVVTGEFLAGHSAEAIPSCLAEHRLDAIVRDSRSLYVVVRGDEISEADEFPSASVG